MANRVKRGLHQRGTRMKLARSNIAWPSRAEGPHQLRLVCHRDDHKDFSLLPSEAVHLMRCLAGKIQAIAFFQLELFAVEFDRDAPADNEQHFFTGMKRPLNFLVRR